MMPDDHGGMQVHRPAHEQWVEQVPFDLLYQQDRAEDEQRRHKAVEDERYENRGEAGEEGADQRQEGDDEGEHH